MTNKTKIFISSVAALAVILVAVGVFIVWDNNHDIVEPLPIESSSAIEEKPVESSSSSVEDAAEKYDIPPILPLPSKEEKETQEPQKNEQVVTKKPDGTKTTEIVRPEFEKPEPPAPPKVDEDKATDPEKPPEYTPEQKKPNKEPEKPTGGEKKDGQIYVPGFGWMEDKGTGSGTGEVAENMNPNGNIIGH